MRLTRALIVQDRVAVGEGAALGVLARDADRDPLDEQAREGERLGLPPVDPALVHALAPALELLQQLLVPLEAVRHLEQLLVQRLEPLRRDGGDDGAAGVGRDPSLLRRLRHRDRRLQPVVRIAKLLLGPRRRAPSPALR